MFLIKYLFSLIGSWFFMAAFRKAGKLPCLSRALSNKLMSAWTILLPAPQRSRSCPDCARNLEGWLLSTWNTWRRCCFPALPVAKNCEQGLYDLIAYLSCWMNKEEKHLPEVWWYLGYNLCIARTYSNMSWSHQCYSKMLFKSSQWVSIHSNSFRLSTLCISHRFVWKVLFG